MIEEFCLEECRAPAVVAMIGATYGRMTVVAVGVPKGTYRYTAVCQCSCGAPLKAVRADKLKSGHTTSCGCAQKDASKTHGCRSHPLYTVWSRMMSRCYNPKDKRYRVYGQRGIVVCDRWHNPNFFIEDMSSSFKEGLTIERIDNNQGYSLENCCWKNRAEQNRNRTNFNIFVTINHETKCLAEWSREYGINYGTLIDRIKRGWNPVKAVTTSV